MEGQAGFVGTLVAAVEFRLSQPATAFEGRTRSWQEVLDRAARVAAGIRALGVESGDRVAILSSNSDDYLTLFLAIPWAGAVIAPLNSRWSPTEITLAIEDCTPRLLFVTPEAADANGAMIACFTGRITIVGMGEPRPGLLHIDDLLVHDPIPDAARGGTDLLAIFYTGGTTGRSKGVMLSHAGVITNSQAMRDLGLFPDGTRALIAAPLFHLAAVAAMTMTILAGGTAVIMRGFDPGGALDLILDEQVSDALLVPTMIQMILDAPGFDPAKLAGLTTVMYGASPMPAATLDRIMAAAPHIRFYQAYGMTEVSCTATLLPPEFHCGEHRAAGRHRSAGQAMPGTDLIIVDAHDAPVPDGEVGEILVRGPGVMLGYWGQADMTAQTLRGGWMHTGDGGRIGEHGLLYVVDRLKDMVVSGGENVYSAEVESAIATHPAVAQCAVIGVPDPRWGERVHAVIVARPGIDVSQEAIADHCRTLIAGYKCPRSIELRVSLPLSAAGKILKQELRAEHWQGHDRKVG